MKKTAIHTNWYIYAFGTLVFAHFTVGIIIQDPASIPQSVVCNIIWLLIGAYGLWTKPLRYIFDEKGLTISYAFGRYVRYEWNTVFCIEKILIERGRSYYVIRGKAKANPQSLADYKLDVNRRTRKLIRRFWKDNFER